MNINKTMLCSKIYYFTIMLIAFLLPLNKKVVPPLIIILVLAWLIEGRFREKFANIKYPGVVLIFVAFYLIHVTGLLYSANMGFALFDLEIKLSILIFPLLFSTAPVLNKKQLNNILFAFIAGCLLGVLVCLSHATYMFITTDEIDYSIYMQLSIFHHPTYFSMYMCMAISVMICFLLKGKQMFSSGYMFFFSLLILLFSVFIILLSAKSGIICLSLIFLITIFHLIIQMKKVLLGTLFLISSVLIIMMTFKLVPHPYNRIQTFVNVVFKSDTDIEKSTKESTAVRLLIWPVALDLIEENFLFGVGTGDIKDSLLEKYEEKGLSGALENRLNAHNQYLQTFAALGLVGFLILFGGLLLPFIFSIRHKKYIYLLFLVIIAANFLTESILEVQAGVVFYAFFNSLLFFENTD